MIASTTLLLLAALPLSSAAPWHHGDTTRICLAPADAQIPYRDNAGAAAAVRETLTGFLTGPSLAVTPLTARLASQTREEAKQVNCRYLLFTTVKQVRKTGSGLLRRMAGSAAENGAWQVAAGGAGAGSVTRMMAASAAVGAATTNFASAVQVKDELTLEYRLESADGQALLGKTEKRKAKSDGEDLISPLVQRAAEAIAAVVAGPGR
jgi:hypothetical protein